MTKPKSAKVRVVMEIDETLLREIDRVRGEVSLERMLGIIVEFGFGTMRNLAKRHINPYAPGGKST